MTVIAALLTASCLFPDEAPPDLSKSLEASAMAMLISCEVPPLLLSLLLLWLLSLDPPEVNFLSTCMAAALPSELAFMSEDLSSS